VIVVWLPARALRGNGARVRSWLRTGAVDVLVIDAATSVVAVPRCGPEEFDTSGAPTSEPSVLA